MKTYLLSLSVFLGLVFLPGFRADDTAVVRNTTFLATASNDGEGIRVRTYYNNTGYNSDRPSFQDRFVRGRRLSAECSEDFRGCEITIVALDSTTGREDQVSVVRPSQSFIEILPADGAIGFLKLRVDSATGLPSYAGEPHFTSLGNIDCSPASPPYHVGNYRYLLCANSQRHFLTLVTLKLNATHPERSKVSDEEYLRLTQVRNLTNSILVDLPAQSGTVIYVASEYTVYEYRPLYGIVGELSIDLEGNDCLATAIEYIGGWEMIVYCDNDRAAYVDINREFIFATVDFAKDGRPYVCPNPDIYLAVNSEHGYIQYAFRSTEQATNFEIFSTQFDSGVCVGSVNTTLFAFTDREEGTQLLNASGSSIRSLSGATCLNHPCQPLVVLEDRYLTIREKRGLSWYISLLDTHNNFSLVLEASHVRADLMAVIRDVRMMENRIKPTNVTPITYSTPVDLNIAATPVVNNSGTKQTDEKDSEKTVLLWIPVAAIVSFLIISGVVGAIVVLVQLMRNRIPVNTTAEKESLRDQTPPQEAGENPRQTQSTAPILSTTDGCTQEKCSGDLRGDDRLAPGDPLPLAAVRVKIEAEKLSVQADA